MVYSLCAYHCLTDSLVLPSQRLQAWMKVLVVLHEKLLNMLASAQKRIFKRMRVSWMILNVPFANRSLRWRKGFTYGGSPTCLIQFPIMWDKGDVEGGRPSSKRRRIDEINRPWMALCVTTYIQCWRLWTPWSMAIFRRSHSRCPSSFFLWPRSFASRRIAEKTTKDEGSYPASLTCIVSQNGHEKHNVFIECKQQLKGDFCSFHWTGNSVW